MSHVCHKMIRKNSRSTEGEKTKEEKCDKKLTRSECCWRPVQNGWALPPSAFPSCHWNTGWAPPGDEGQRSHPGDRPNRRPIATLRKAHIPPLHRRQTFSGDENHTHAHTYTYTEMLQPIKRKYGGWDEQVLDWTLCCFNGINVNVTYLYSESSADAITCVVC